MKVTWSLWIAEIVVIAVVVIVIVIVVRDLLRVRFVSFRFVLFCFVSLKGGRIGPTGFAKKLCRGFDNRSRRS